MDIPDGLMPAPFLWAAAFIYLLLLGRAVVSAPWGWLRTGDALHPFLGACVALLLVWSMRAGISPGLNLHYLGMTLLTLMFGWQLALVGASLVLLGVTLNGGAGWESFAINALLMGALPILFSHRLLAGVERHLPNNYFVYVLANGFFGAGLAAALVMTAAGGLLLAGGVYTTERLAYEFLPFLPLLMLPEAFLNGGLAAILVAFRPEWVRTFDDRRYIAGK